MFQAFIKAHVPTYTQIPPEKYDQAILAIVGKVALEGILDGVLSWINHPEYVEVNVAREGDTFHLTSSYNSTDYDAVVTIKGAALEYLKPWAASRNPQPPIFGVKMTLPNWHGEVEVLLIEHQKDDPASYDIRIWGRCGSMYDGAVFENIPGAVEWREGETQDEFAERAHVELSAKAGVATE